MILVQIPTNDEEKEEEDKFYQQLQNILDETPRYDMLLDSLGAWNAKGVDQQQVGDQEGWESMAYKDRKKRVVCQFTIKSNVMSSVAVRMRTLENDLLLLTVGNNWTSSDTTA